MSASLEFGILQVPPGIANLSFRIATPRDWNAPDLPADDGTGWIQSLRSKARLRNQDVGFVPNLLEMDAETAKLGVGALRGLIKVALGWHVIEDGSRVRVHDPGGRIQIHINLMAKDGRDVDEILDEIQAEAAQSYPHPEFRRRQEGQICRLSVENISVDHEPIEQAHLLPPWAHDSAFVRIRVTADPASMQYAIYYAEAIVNNFEYGHPDSHQQDSDQVSGPAHHEPDSGPAPDPPEIGPEFFRRARRLEREDRLKEAE